MCYKNNRYIKTYKGVYNVDALLLYSFSALNRWGGEDIIEMLPKKQRELFKKTRAEHKKIKLLNATYNKPLPSYFWVTVFVLHIAGILILIF